MSIKRADVIVIGAGLVGSSAAYFLSKEGLKVVVLEKNAVGSGTSGHAPASLGLSLHYTEPPVLGEMSRWGSQQTMELAPAVAQETGIDVHFKMHPYFILAFSPQAWQEIRRLAPLQNLDYELLTPAECYQREPQLNREVEVYGALWVHWAARVDAYRLNLALARAAEQQGAQFLTRTVTALVKEGGKVAGVLTSNGEPILSDKVVLAMGVWTPDAAKWLGIPLPVHAIKGEQLLLEYDGPPILDAHWHGWGISSPPMSHLLITRRGNSYVLGTTGGPSNETYVFDNTTRPEAEHAIISFATRLLPCLKAATVAGRLTGPQPIPDDGLPILGPVPDLDGVYVIAGNPGVQCCASWGKLARDLVIGRPLAYSLKPFLPERFTKPVQAKHGLLAVGRGRL